MTTTFETAKVGDKVWSVDYGWGVVQNVSFTTNYPLRVMFDAGSAAAFKLNGKRYNRSISPTLFWDEVKIEAPQKPLPDLEVDTKVLVWVSPEHKHKRHFAHFNQGFIYTFDSGSTSFSRLHAHSITGWPYWELAE